VGFTVDAAGNCLIGDVRLVLEGGDQGLCAWSLDGIDSGGGIDGLATHRAGATVAAPTHASDRAHRNGVVAIDHVVVTSPDPARTINALQAVGLDPRRTRDHGAMRQTFFRLGPVILELVGPPAPDGDGPARFWGIAFTVADLDATARFLGDHLGAVKDAVQPGRRIASLRREAGLSLPVAFMS
jgi:hypothetical protein